MWPLLPKTNCTAATLPAPNAVSSAKTTIFLPDDFGGKMFAASRTSCSVCRPARNVLRLSPVIASAAAAPEMYSTLFCAASGPSWSAMPDEPVPAMIFTPCPTSLLNALIAVAGSVASSM